MAVREIKTPALAKESGVPYGTLRRILELNSVADYEQLRRIAEALRMPLSEIIEDAENLAEDPDVIADWREENGLGPTPDDTDVALASAADDSIVPDMSGWSADEQAAYVASHMDQFDIAAKKGDIEREQTEYEDLP
jgi:transcriptional regulator with XRE-family HTH domain